MSYHESNDVTVSEQTHKRPRNDQPGRARTLDVGFQSTWGVYDGQNVQNDMSGGNSILPQVSLAAHTIIPGDVMFTFENGSCNDLPLLRKLFNEHVAQFALMWPDDPEMIMFAMEQSIRPMGVAYEYQKIDATNLKPTTGIKYMGLESISNIGNVHCGKRMLYRLKPFGSTLRGNTLGTDGVDESLNSYGLYLSPYNESTVGTLFNKAAYQLITNSSAWENALAGFPGKAAPWMGAVWADFRHCQYAAITMIEKLLRYGILTVNQGIVGAGGVQNKLAANVESFDPNNANVRTPDELLKAFDPANPVASRQLESYETAARLANFIGLTSPTNTLTGTLNAAAFQFYAELLHQVAESVYYSVEAHTTSNADAASVNAAAEFGAVMVGQQPLYFGRHRDKSIKNDRIGSVLAVQVVNTQQASSAYAHAMDYIDKWTAGTCLAGSAAGKAIIMLHK